MNEGTPPPSNQVRSLVDRSHLMGDAGRTGIKQSASDPEGFKNMLSSEVKRHERKTLDQLGEELNEQKAASEFGQVAADLAALAKTTETDNRDLRAQLKDKEENEAERSVGGGWRGPQAIIGLNVMSGPPPNLALQLGETEKPRSERKTQVSSEEIMAAEARVKPELILGLQEAGLVTPLIGLGDPRLAGSVPMLAEDEGWVEGPARSGLSFVWQKGPRAYQRLEWSDQHTMIETAVDERVQWLERRGHQITVKESGRENPRKYKG